jgi:hypothetical protein
VPEEAALEWVGGGGFLVSVRYPKHRSGGDDEFLKRLVDAHEGRMSETSGSAARPAMHVWFSDMQQAHAFREALNAGGRFLAHLPGDQ